MKNKDNKGRGERIEEIFFYSFLIIGGAGILLLVIMLNLVRFGIIEG